MQSQSNHDGDGNELSRSLENQSKPKRGRPKGSKTKDHPMVVITPKNCVKCGCTHMLTLRTIRTRKMTGEIDGRKYDSITWRRERCTNCGQIHNTKTHRLTFDKG